MRKKLLFCAVVCLFALTNLLQAQDNLKWKMDLSEASISSPKSIKQMKSGVIVVYDETSVCGIDPFEKKILWKYKSGTTSTLENVQEVFGTPFMKIEIKGIVSAFPRVILLNTMTGKELMDTKEEGLRFEQIYTLGNIGCIVVEATNTKAKRRLFSLIDAKTESIRWTKDIGEGKSAMGSIIGSIYTKYMVTDKDGQLLFIDKKEMTRFDAKTGDVIWKQEFKNQIGEIYLSDNGQTIYTGYAGKNVLELLDIKTGEKQLPKGIKIDGNFQSIWSYKGSKVFLVTSSGFNIFDLSTNTFEWKKSAKIDKMADLTILNNGFICDRSEKDKDMLYYFDLSGKKVWAKNLNEKLITYEICPQGVFYVTDKTSNILDLSKGKKVWKKDLSMSNVPAFCIDKKTNKVTAIFADRKLYRLNMDAGESSLLAEKIKFKDFDQEIERAVVEKVTDGFAISTAQNLAIISDDGVLKFQKYYPPTGLSSGVRTAMKFASSAASIAADGFVMSGVAYGFGGALTGSVSLTNKANNQFVSAGASYFASDAFNALSKRNSATTATSEHIFFLTKFDDGTAGILAVEKETGNEYSKVLFKDKKPIYFIDSFEGLFFLASDKELLCFQL